MPVDKDVGDEAAGQRARIGRDADTSRPGLTWRRTQHAVDCQDGDLAFGNGLAVKASEVRHRLVDLGDAVCRGPVGMHDASVYALVIERGDLLAQHLVFEQGRPRRPAFSELWLSATFKPWLVVNGCPASMVVSGERSCAL